MVLLVYVVWYNLSNAYAIMVKMIKVMHDDHQFEKDLCELGLTSITTDYNVARVTTDIACNLPAVALNKTLCIITID